MLQLKSEYLLSNPLKARALFRHEAPPRQMVEDVLDQDESDLTSQQLHHELEQSLAVSADISPPGGRLSLLPPELISQIISYVVVVPGNVHIFVPLNNSKHGWRLSLCPESSFDPCWGTCSCQSGRSSGTAAEYLDTALLLVSQAMRQTTLDIIFAKNHFTFTDMHDLRDFATEIPSAAARIQFIRLHHAVDDSSFWAFQAKNMVATRRQLKRLRQLDLRLLLSHCSSYESIHEDGFLNEVCHFRKPLLEKFECSVQWRGQPRYWRSLGLDQNIPARVQTKLVKIFTGVYGDEIPFNKPPPEKIQEADLPLSNKKGIIAWSN